MTENADKRTLEILGEMRTVRINGRDVQMPNWAIALTKQLETALKGNSIAQRDIQTQYRRALVAEAERIEVECQIWGRIKAHQERLLAALPPEKRVPGAVLPHPADIEIDPDRGVRLMGPLGAEEFSRHQATMRFRDAFFLQQVLEDRTGASDDEPPSAGSPLALAIMMDNALPPSLRLSDHEKLKRMTGRDKRTLLKEVRAAWRAAGANVPRGWVFPSRARIAGMVRVVYQHVPAFAAATSGPALTRLSEDVATEVWGALRG